MQSVRRKEIELMAIEKTYKMSDQKVPPSNWEDYKRITLNEWKQLLNGIDKKEKDFQMFLELNPSLIPGAHSLALTSGHMPIYASCFSQPVLPGIKCKIPDFMWLSTCSDELNPILIEIEDPKKKWFNRNGQPTAKFTQAHNQINEWRVWFSKPNNVNLFIETYKIDTSRAEGRRIVPHYVLIYGRREDVLEKSSERSAYKKPDETIMTYDRLQPSYEQSKYLCIKIKNNGFHVITFPSTGKIGPNIIEEWINLKGLDEAIKKSSEIAENRKRFLLQRLPYWIEWAKDSNAGIIDGGDWE
ncbi:MAG: hypothetical protein C4B59_10565 [Candidatus Methanogaster sp.]|uniref:Uncharacterized protein n=1 Tax=Candidatus Methanogaster sp. TaxID=3386292 RepID=A0AC61L1N5_9EURY|nr:MAG: hypothetical protein C4B59_10565 [ANME-2 cluster archaeon]